METNRFEVGVVDDKERVIREDLLETAAVYVSIFINSFNN